MSGNIEIRKEDSSDGGRYVATFEGSEAEMTYTKLGPSLISIDHTFVPDSMRGKGVAQALAKMRFWMHAVAVGKSFRVAASCRHRLRAIPTGRMFWEARAFSRQNRFTLLARKCSIACRGCRLRGFWALYSFCLCPFPSGPFP